ncbi:serine hydrolase domain-containing protein [Thalassospira sp.]|uniref:serine hydrolase domain-containing protein n=1 Tax=Thalassospira sp. TaxID=1912094 RepID=UPI003AA96E7B
MKPIKIAICLSLLSLSFGAFAQEEKGLAPVSKAIEGWSAEETLDNIRNFSVRDLVITSERALWYHRYASQTNKTAILVRRQPTMELPNAIIPDIGNIRAETALGSLTLDEFLVSPDSYAQGFVVVHKGKVAYETYPGMLELDPHFTASVSKVLASLVIDQMIDDGLIDENKSLGSYVPEFVGSAWENVPVVDALDMSVGLNVSEYDRTSDVSIISRLMAAELGEPINGKLENMLDVMLDAEPQGEPGDSFIYSSVVTQSLVFLAEAVSKKSWSDYFDERVWSKIGVEGPLQVHLSPDGMAIVHGPMSINLRDLARLGMLYTPSWSKVSTEQVVSPMALDRLQNTPRTREFYLAGNGPAFMDRLGDNTVKTAARQWDAIWPDGDFFKAGLNTQGLYVSPKRDLVIAYFSTEPSQQMQKYLRPIATSGLFD